MTITRTHPTTAVELRKSVGGDVSLLNIDAVKAAAQQHLVATDVLENTASRAGRSLLASESRTIAAHLSEAEALHQLLDEVTEARGISNRHKAASRAERDAEIRAAVERTGIRQFGTASVNPSDTRALGDWLRHELRVMDGTQDPGAAFAPVDYSTTVLRYLAATTVHGLMGVSTMTTNAHSMKVPKLQSGVAVGWTAEGGTITAADPTATYLTATPKAVKGLVTITNELLSDSNPAVVDVIAQNLVGQLGRALDVAIFEGTGSANSQPLGIKGTAGINTVSMGNNGGVPTNLDPIADAIAAVQAANGTANAIVCHPRTANTLRKLKDGANRPLLVSPLNPGEHEAGEIFGVKVFTSSQLSITETSGTSNDCSSIYVVDASQIVMVMRNEAQVVYDPYSSFNKDATNIRAVLRADVVFPNVTALTRITGVRA